MRELMSVRTRARRKTKNKCALFVLALSTCLKYSLNYDFNAILIDRKQEKKSIEQCEDIRNGRR